MALSFRRLEDSQAVGEIYASKVAEGCIGMDSIKVAGGAKSSKTHNAISGRFRSGNAPL